MPSHQIPLGGDISYSQKFSTEYCFSTGRDSLLTIFKSISGRVKRLLLPDFLCSVILDYAAEFAFEIEFYAVDNQLTLQVPRCNEGDALYLINYFGDDKSYCLGAIDPSVVVIIDDVFCPSLRHVQFEGIYFTFNSLRKISPLPEVSFLGSNFPINSPPPHQQSWFHHLNRFGKQLKQQALDNSAGVTNAEERYYVDVLRQSELWRDREKGPFRPSQESLAMLPDYYIQVREAARHRRTRYRKCVQQFPENVIPMNASYPSHAPLWISRRDEAIKELKHNAIFLPGIWPRKFGIPNNGLYDHLLCVPLDPRFTKSKLDLILNIVKDHL